MGDGNGWLLLKTCANAAVQLRNLSLPATTRVLEPRSAAEDSALKNQFLPIEQSKCIKLTIDTNIQLRYTNIRCTKLYISEAKVTDPVRIRNPDSDPGGQKPQK
jgi:hypothetical protein